MGLKFWLQTLFFYVFFRVFYYNTMKFSTKHDKGVAGLNLFLSLIVMLFTIGLIVMVFSLMGGELIQASYTPTGGSPTGEILAVDNVTATSFAVSGLQDVGCSVAVFYNQTGGETIAAGNYTVTGCSVIASATSLYNGTNWLTNYTYSYNADNDATHTIGNTTQAIGSAIDWFDIFIVIGAMVVLILLTVIIIAAIRGSGLIEGGSQGSGGGFDGRTA